MYNLLLFLLLYESLIVILLEKLFTKWKLNAIKYKDVQYKHSYFLSIRHQIQLFLYSLLYQDWRYHFFLEEGGVSLSLDFWLFLLYFIRMQWTFIWYLVNRIFSWCWFKVHSFISIKNIKILSILIFSR